MAIQEIKSRPILFSGEMVRAILQGRKSCTRRVVNFGKRAISWNGPYIEANDDPESLSTSLHEIQKISTVSAGKRKYGKPGDRLYVRESFSPRYFDGGLPAYKADWTVRAADYVPEPKWKPAIHMPRSASRITLEIQNIRVERLHAITQADIRKEGGPDNSLAAAQLGTKDAEYLLDYGWFSAVWNKLNGKKYPFASDPYVWVIEFKKIQP